MAWYKLWVWVPGLSRPLCGRDLVLRLSELAKIEISESEVEDICRDLERIASYLGELRKAALKLKNIDPLYHVWEESSIVRDKGAHEKISVADFAPEALEGSYVRAPWRGRRS